MHKEKEAAQVVGHQDGQGIAPSDGRRNYSRLNTTMPEATKQGPIRRLSIFGIVAALSLLGGIGNAAFSHDSSGG